MSHFLERKQHHEERCESAIRQGDWSAARLHAAKAADYALSLSRKVDNASLAHRYLEEAESWLDIIERLDQPQPSPSKQADRSPRKTSAEPESPENSNANEWLITEKPDVRLDSIAGMTAAKETLRQMVILPLSRPDLARQLGLKPGGGILIYGPPGNGKTLLGKAIAAELDAPFFYASGAQIRSKWHGESEQRLRQLIQAARQEEIAILFLDEVEALLPKRSGGSVVDNRIVTQFLAEIGGFEESPNTLLLLGATNLPWDIDEAVFRTGRFDEKIYIPPPDLEARTAIFQLHLKGAQLTPEVNPNSWAHRLEGYTGSDIAGLVLAAKRHALSRCLLQPDQPPLLEPEDFEKALTAIFPSAPEKSLQKYQQFSKSRGKG